MFDAMHADSPPKLAPPMGRDGLMGARTEYPAGSGLHSGRWAHALVLVLCIGGAAVLSSDSTPPAPTALVVFMGIDSPTADASFQRFVAAVDRLPVDSRRRIRVEFAESGLRTDETRTAAARRIASLRPVIVVAPSSATAKIAKQHLAGTPVVFGSFLDPVRYGIVSSMEARPEAMTGVWVADTLDAKRLEI
ncbi:MAG: hypothetical protein EON57_16210, partial [Alphaproteobacteria bacterium]